MNTILRKITNECYNNKNSKFYNKVGNYEIKRNNDFIIHKYYGNTICIVNLNEKHFSLYYCGYENHRLTTAQINYLRNFYLEKNYNLRLVKS